MVYLSNPESSAEQARLLAQDDLIIQAFGQQAHQPTTQDVLDLACGTGSWALEMATQVTGRVVGIDLSEGMITHARDMARMRQLANTLFVIGDILKPLPFADASFDLVNARFLSYVVPERAWPPLLAEIYRVLRPGGQTCHQELDLPSGTSVAFLRLQRWSQVVTKQRGLLLALPDQLRPWLQDLGFGRVVAHPRIFDWSAGQPLHAPVAQDIRVWYKLIGPAIIESGIVSKVEYEQTYEQLAPELQDPSFQGSCLFWTIWGQKPS